MITRRLRILVERHRAREDRCAIVDALTWAVLTDIEKRQEPGRPYTLCPRPLRPLRFRHPPGVVHV